MELVLTFALIYSVIFSVIGYNMGKRKTIGSTSGALLGFFLGLIGVLIVACYPSDFESEMSNLEYDTQIAQSYSKLNEASSSPDDLIKWFDLKEKGAITEEEFETQKKKLLKNQ